MTSLNVGLIGVDSHAWGAPEEPHCSGHHAESGNVCSAPVGASTLARVVLSLGALIKLIFVSTI